ncbi:hypothetical protein ACFPRL_36240 [Pseudoclavibacter helvolus]
MKWSTASSSSKSASCHPISPVRTIFLVPRSTSGLSSPRRGWSL